MVKIGQVLRIWFVSALLLACGVILPTQAAASCFAHRAAVGLIDARLIELASIDTPYLAEAGAGMQDARLVFVASGASTALLDHPQIAPVLAGLVGSPAARPPSQLALLEARSTLNTLPCTQGWRIDLPFLDEAGGARTPLVVIGLGLSLTTLLALGLSRLRRRHDDMVRRYEVEAAVTVRSKSKEFRAKIVDLSRSGARIDLGMRPDIAKGDRLTLFFLDQWKEADVMWRNEGFAGTRFVRPISSGALGAARRRSQKEKRRAQSSKHTGADAPVAPVRPSRPVRLPRKRKDPA